MQSRLALRKIAMGSVVPIRSEWKGVRSELSPPNEPDRQGAAKENSSTDVAPLSPPDKSTCGFQ